MPLRLPIRVPLVCVLPFLLGAALMAQVAAPPAQPATPAALRAKMLARTGGMIIKPVAGPSLLFLDTRDSADGDSVIRDVAATLSRVMRLPIKVVAQKAADPLAEAAGRLADTNTAAIVVVANLPGQPSLLIAPESRWALLNAAALGGGDTPAALRDERLRKEIWRAFGYLMGAGLAPSGKGLMSSVCSLADLDALTATGISIENFGRVMTHAKALGVEPQRMTPYRKAVEEGWAPAPTNDVQKTIWNEVKGKK
jgi:hypothetical protein